MRGETLYHAGSSEKATKRSGEQRRWPTIVVGGGPSAALYLSRSERREDVLVVAPALGGGMSTLGSDTLQSHWNELEIEETPGSPRLRDYMSDFAVSPTGNEYSAYVRDCILDSGAGWMRAAVDDVWREGGEFVVRGRSADSAVVHWRAQNVVLATGTSAIDPPAEIPVGRAISSGEAYARIAAGDAERFRDKEIVIVGGGNSAMQIAARVVSVAKRVVVLASRYVGRYPDETRDRFAWRAPSQTAHEIAYKSASTCRQGKHCLRYVVYRDMRFASTGDLEFSWSPSENDRTALALASFDESHRCRQLEKDADGCVERVSSDNLLLIWATGVAPAFPPGERLARLLRERMHREPSSCAPYVADSQSQPGLEMVGCCTGAFRSVDEMSSPATKTPPCDFEIIPLDASSSNVVCDFVERSIARGSSVRRFDADAPEELRRWLFDSGAGSSVVGAVSGGRLIAIANLALFHPRSAYSETVEFGYFASESSLDDRVGEDLRARLLETARRAGISVVVAFIPSNQLMSPFGRLTSDFETRGVLSEGSFDTASGKYVDAVIRVLGLRAEEVGT